MRTPSKHKGQNLLDPNYIVGFVDGEGCFSVGCSRRPDIKSGYDIRAAFEIEMTTDDREVLERIHETLGKPGHIYDFEFKRYPRWKPHTKLKVSSMKGLTEVIIPFFKKHQLNSKKRKKKHLKIRYEKQIVEMRNKMNPTGKGNRKYNLVQWGSRSAGNPLATPNRKKVGPDRYS